MGKKVGGELCHGVVWCANSNDLYVNWCSLENLAVMRYPKKKVR